MGMFVQMHVCKHACMSGDPPAIPWREQAIPGDHARHRDGAMLRTAAQQLLHSLVMPPTYGPFQLNEVSSHQSTVEPLPCWTTSQAPHGMHT
jgi:hypothetical protein